MVQIIFKFRRKLIITRIIKKGVKNVLTHYVFIFPDLLLSIMKNRWSENVSYGNPTCRNGKQQIRVWVKILFWCIEPENVQLTTIYLYTGIFSRATTRHNGSSNFQWNFEQVRVIYITRRKRAGYWSNHPYFLAKRCRGDDESLKLRNTRQMISFEIAFLKSKTVVKTVVPFARNNE